MAEIIIPDLSINRRRTRTYDARGRDDLDSVLAAIAATLTPPGTVLPTFSDVEPGDAWKLLNGQWLPKAEFSRLFAIFGDRFGESETEFRLPDLRGRTVFGAGGDVGIEAMAMAGAHQIALTLAQIPAHSHGVTDPGHSHSFTADPHDHDAAAVGADLAASGSARAVAEAGTSGAAVVTGTIGTSTSAITVDEAGEGEDIDILPPVIGVYWMVKT